MSPKPTSVKPTIVTPTSDVTPEAAIEALVRELNAAGLDGLRGKGARNNNMRIALGQLCDAVDKVRAIEDEARKLREGMSGLIKGALDAIAGKAPIKPAKPGTTPTVNGGDPASATTAPTV